VRACGASPSIDGAAVVDVQYLDDVVRFEDPVDHAVTAAPRGVPALERAGQRLPYPPRSSRQRTGHELKTRRRHRLRQLFHIPPGLPGRLYPVRLVTDVVTAHSSTVYSCGALEGGTKTVPRSAVIAVSRLREAESFPKVVPVRHSPGVRIGFALLNCGRRAGRGEHSHRFLQRLEIIGGEQYRYLPAVPGDRDPLMGAFDLI
jgi:hypothetical protein